MPHVDLYTRLILDEISAGRAGSQRSVAQHLGIALGRANSLMRDLIDRGWVEPRPDAPSARHYVLTSAGRKQLASLTRRHMDETVAVYASTRQRLVDLFAAVSATCHGRRREGDDVEARRVLRRRRRRRDRLRRAPADGPHAGRGRGRRAARQVLRARHPVQRAAGRLRDRRRLVRAAHRDDGEPRAAGRLGAPRPRGPAGPDLLAERAGDGPPSSTGRRRPLHLRAAGHGRPGRDGWAGKRSGMTDPALHSERAIYHSPLHYVWNQVLFPLKMIVPQPAVRRLPGLTTNEDIRVGMVLKHVRGRLLDIGCGKNRLARAYREKGGDGIGVDVYDWGNVDLRRLQHRPSALRQRQLRHDFVRRVPQPHSEPRRGPARSRAGSSRHRADCSSRTSRPASPGSGTGMPSGMRTSTSAG